MEHCAKLNFPEEYWQDFVVRMAHHSTAIEGNRLTQDEVKRILLDRVIPRAMAEREYYEVLNYRAYSTYLRENYTRPIDLDVIKETQAILLAHIREDAGRFKQAENIILGASFVPSKPYQVIEHLQNWSDNLQYRLANAADTDDKIRAVMESHLYFERIHPFPDGNGRTGRALMVHSCLHEGIPPIVIEKEQRHEYIRALDAAATDKLFALGRALSEKEGKAIAARATPGRE